MLLNGFAGVRPMLAAMLVVGAIGQSNPSIAISVWAVSQPDAPLRVKEFRKSPIETRGIEIVLRNTTDKPIRAFRIIAKARAACPGDGNAEVWGNGSALDKQPVAPGASVQAEEQVADTTIINLARRLKTSYLHVQVGVLEVEFADGSVWKNRFPGNSQLFDPTLVASDAKRCQAWPTSASEINQIKGETMIVRDPGAGVIELRSDGYFMTCALKDGKVFCPTY